MQTMAQWTLNIFAWHRIMRSAYFWLGQSLLAGQLRTGAALGVALIGISILSIMFQSQPRKITMVALKMSLIERL